MAVTFIPSPGAPWFTVMETEVNVSKDLAIVPSESTIDSVVWSITPELPPNVVIHKTTSGLNLSAPTLDGLFPILLIKYLRGGVIGECKDFNDLPADAEDVIEYRKDPNSPRIYTLTVTVTDTQLLPPLTSETTATFTFIIEADYSPGRDRLRREIDARRT